MPVFRVQVFYRHGAAEKWSNVWHVSQDQLLDARDSFHNIAVPALVDLLDPSCTLVKILVSSLTTDDFSELLENAVGTHFGSGTLLPLFNRVKVFFQPAGLGRPDYKFIGGLVGEDNQDADGFLTTAAADLDTALTAMLDDMLSDGAPFVSENGDVWGDVSVQIPVQMRQLHRRRRRVVAP